MYLRLQMYILGTRIDFLLKQVYICEKHLALKTKIVLSLFLAVLMSISCSKNKFDTGIDGTLQIGSGDCMPVINYSDRVYEDYSGNIYFIRKSDLNQSGANNVQLLKENGICKRIRHGEMFFELPADTFYVLTDEINSTNLENMVVIAPDQILQCDLKIFVCTSY